MASNGGAAHALVLTRRALRILQSDDYPLYVFSLTADEILRIADVSRLSRDQSGDLIGYQRPEVRQHIQEITDYLDSDAVIFPNPIILALSSDVRFTRSRGPNVSDGSAEAGTLEIPFPTGEGRKPGWIVDGQQRAFALANARRRDFPVPVNAFIADSVDVQRDQFLRVNNTRPLPRGLVTELLPTVRTPLPARLAMSKTPSALCDLLNRDDDSPFRGLIRRASTPKDQRRAAVITDSSVVHMLRESLTSPSGALFPYRNMTTGETDFDSLWGVLLLYWTAVKETFPDAWGKPAERSRLSHGAGIRAMGRLMDRVLGAVNPRHPRAAEQVRAELAHIAPRCRWTGGRWDELGLRWNEVQNVPRHINELSSFLVRAHLQREAG
jgi:DGQHR domain-containing protein